MKVADLAAELEVPTSTILDQCQRFGIDAAWAGAELGGADVVVLRAELAATEAIDLTPADPVVEAADPVVEAADPVAEAADAPDPAAESDPESVVASEPAAEPPAPTGAGVLPPTAVGSIPELIDEVSPGGPVDGSTAERAPGFNMAGADPEVANVEGVRTVRHREPPAKRRVDRSARTAVLALFVGVAAFVASNFVNLAIFVVLLWLVSAIALVVAVYDSIRGRRHARTHPDRTSGVWLASITLVLAIAGIIGITASVVATVGDDSPEEAPLGIGDLKSVQLARWGYQRTSRLAGNGWKEPARPVGTCWTVDSTEPLDEQRVEYTEATEKESCNWSHTVEVAKVFAMNRDADSIYPGAEGVALAADQECKALLEKAQAKDPKATLEVEFPTESGWDDGDHDVACLIVTPARQGRLVT